MRHPVLALALACSLVAWSGCADPSGPAPAASSSAPEAPPAPPADLALHVALAPIDVAWPALLAAFGDEARTWPRTAPGALVAELGLPITVAELVSTNVPMSVVVLAAEKGGPEAVVAIHLRGADRAVVLATGGEGAPFRAERDGDGVRLVSSRPGGEGKPRLAVIGNHLVAATSDEALAQAGRFVARAPAPALAAGVLAAATMGPRAPTILSWAGGRLAGLVPAVPGLAPSMSTDDQLRLFGLFFGADLTLRLEGGALQLEAKAPASLEATAAAALVPHGPATPWLALPRGVSFAALVHATSLEREREAVRSAETLAAATQLDAKRRDAIASALQDLAVARSPSVAFALGSTPGGPVAWFRAGIEDGKAADAALDALVRAAGKAKAPPGASVLSAKTTVIERVGEAVRLKVRVGEEVGAAVDVLIRRDEGGLFGAAGRDASAALEALRGATGDGSLGAEPLARRVAQAAEAHAALAFVDLGRADPTEPGRTTPQARAAMAGSLTLQGGVRVLVLLEPRAVGLVRAKLAGGAP